MYYIVFLIQYVYNTLFRIIEITKLELYVSDIPDLEVIFASFSYIHVSEETRNLFGVKNTIDIPLEQPHEFL